MKKILLFLSIVFVYNITFGQSGSIYVRTSITGGRWEIIQSPILRSNTFKVDKLYGTVYQMVQTKNKSIIWEKVTVENIHHDNLSNDVNQQINYQLFMGGMMAADAFLININTGHTWQLVKDPQSGIIWFTEMNN